MWTSPNILPTPTLLTYGLLAAAVLALWVPLPYKFSAPLPAGRRVPPWGIALALAGIASLVTGTLDWRAPPAILALVLLARGARTAGRAWVRGSLLTLACILAFLFALHRVPGFHNALLASAVRVSRGAPPFTLYANFDTTVAGIVLMGMFCPRIATAADWRAMLRRVWPVTLSTLIVVLGLGSLLGYVRPDLKWTPVSGAFLAVNLLSTCVTEEAFFRGVLLARMAQAWSGRRYGSAGAVLASTLLFGLAHAGGGPALVLLATIAGLHYAAAYLVSRRIEGAILTHFALNAVHFLAFTYPGLAG